MTDAQKLLPCPFCGGMDEFIELRIRETDLYPYIHCINCGIEFSYGDCIRSAIEKWNQRA